MKPTKERSIIFSAPMILALLAGTKTQTRRIIKEKQPTGHHYLQKMWGRSPPPDPVDHGTPGLFCEVGPDYPDDASDHVMCPYGPPGGRLWVRETWRCIGGVENLYLRDPASIVYRADWYERFEQETWRTPIFMHRWASRITLELSDIRAEQLQDISHDDAIAEGVERHDDDGVTYYGPLNKGHADPCVAYRRGWETIHGAGAWSKNPWVWVLTFRRLQ